MEHNAAYRFLVLKSDLSQHNTIVETKNVEFFEQVFSLKGSDTFEQLIDIAGDCMCEDLILKLI